MDFDKVPEIGQLEEMTSDSTMELMPVVALEEETKAGQKDHFPIGFEIFDSVMKGGIAGGDLVLISGRTGQGKTTLAQTINYHLSQIGIPTAWFSYELTIKDLWDKFKDMGIKAESFKSYVPRPNRGGKVSWIKDKILETILKHNTQVVFIDHLGFLIPEIDESDTRNIDSNFSSYLGRLTRQLKNIAMEHNIIIVVLAHTRKTKESLDVEDIAHSAGIPQESDFVFMVERLKAKTNRTKWATQSDEPEGDIYTPFSRISLQKNRRTGYTKFIKAELRAGRLQEVKTINATEPPEPSTLYLG